jgi:hypothetical protein
MLAWLMRWLSTILGVGLAFAAAAYVLDLPPLASPTFYEAGRRAYWCEGGTRFLLPITFTEDGLTAVVEIGSSKVPLHFSRTAVGDTYKGDGWVLTLDPDANLSGPGGVRRSNCS